MDLGPEDALQMHILPNLPPSGGYEVILKKLMSSYNTYLHIRLLAQMQSHSLKPL